MSYALTSHWLPASQYPLKAPYAMTPQGIIAHNTATAASAADEAAYMVANSSPVGYHVVIDEAQAVECIPFSRNAFHAGDGAEGYANRHLIGIEIARSAGDPALFAQAEDNAALYIAHVCIQYGWTSAQLHKHSDYSKTECPHKTREHWADFLAKIDANIAQLKAPAEESPAQEPRITVLINGTPTTLRGENRAGTIYVSLRDLAEALGYTVSWDGKNASID